MKPHWLGLYALALLLFAGFCLLFPAQIDLFALMQAKDAQLWISIALLLGAYLGLMTVFSVTQLPLTEILAVGFASFVIATFTIKLPHSLGALFILPYCYKIRKNTLMLRKPDPGFSSTIAVPNLFFYLGVFSAIIIFATIVPEFKPDSFAFADSFAEMSTGCPPEQALESCLTSMVARQTQYARTLTVCDKYLGAQRDACRTQINEQYKDAVDQAKAAYGEKTPLNATVAQFYRGLLSEQANTFASSNQNTFRLLFAFGAFSITSSMSGPATFIISWFATLLIQALMSAGLIKQSLSKEHVFNYVTE